MNKVAETTLNSLGEVHYPNRYFEKYQGVGMTSQRTRDRLIQRLMQEGIESVDVLRAMRVTPRHLFLDEALASRSYEDTALPIGHGQTLSQPWVVAKMTEFILSGASKPKTVLEIGTGSGYQTAILAQLIPEVYTVERIGTLAHKAQQVLQKLGLENIHYALSDGRWGWPQDDGKAPKQFDAILSAAAPEALPESLFKQLKVGGRMVIPVGPQSQVQQLMGYEKTLQGIEATVLGEVRFVPMLTGVVKEGEAI